MCVAVAANARAIMHVLDRRLDAYLRNAADLIEIALAVSSDLLCHSSDKSTVPCTH
jgi:hypothetical protein